MSHEKRVAIVVCSIDGLLSLETGVGVIVSAFLNRFGQITEGIDLLGSANPALYCISPELEVGAIGFRADLFSKTAKICNSHGGELLVVSSYADGQQWRALWYGQDITTAEQQWHRLSKAAGDLIKVLADDYTLVIVHSYDTPFAAIGQYTVLPERAKIVWIPQSMGAVFEDDSQDQKIRFEREAISQIVASRSSFIGCGNKYIRSVLENIYSVPSSKLVVFENDIDIEATRYSSAVLKTYCPAILQTLPRNRRIIFAWGRCKPQKGIDIILKAVARIFQLPEFDDCHLVLLAPTTTTEPAFLEEIKGLLEDLPGDRVSAVFEFDEKLPVAIMKSSALGAVILASRFEAVGLAASEALFFSGALIPIVFSPIPAFHEVLDPWPGTYRMENIDAQSLTDALLRAVASPPTVPRTPDLKENPCVVKQREALKQLLSLVGNGLDRAEPDLSFV